MKFSAWKATLLVIGGYLLFCCFGVLPKYMSLVKFPSFIQQYNSAYTYVGYTYEDKLEKEIDKPTIKKGTFDNLGLFSNGNFKNGGHYDANRELFYLNLMNDAVRFKGDENLGKITKHENVYNGVLVKAGKYYYSFGEGFVRIVMNKNSSYGLEYDYYMPGREEYSEIAALLKKQRTEKISIREFAYLLALVGDGTLAYYHKDVQTVVFRERLDENNYIIVSYNLDDGSITRSEPRFEYELEFFVYPQNVMYYDNYNNCIKMYFLETNSEMIMVDEVDSLEKLNYFVYEDGTLLYSFIRNGRIRWEYPSKNVSQEYDYEDLLLTDGEVLLLGEEKAVYYKNTTKNEIEYVYLDIPDYTKTGE